MHSLSPCDIYQSPGVYETINELKRQMEHVERFNVYRAHLKETISLIELNKPYIDIIDCCPIHMTRTIYNCASIASILI